MEELVDLIATDSSPSDVVMLLRMHYTKSAEKLARS